MMPSTQQSIIKENLEALGVRFGSLGVQSPTWVSLHRLIRTFFDDSLF